MTRTKLCDRILPDYTRGEEIFNMVSHIVGAAFGVVALTLCVVFSALKSDAWAVVSSAIYGVSLILLYTMSSVYHGLPLSSPTAKKVMQIMDHCTIYALICGFFIYRTLKIGDLMGIFKRAASSSAMLMMIMGISNIYSYIFARENVTPMVEEFLLSISSSPSVLVFIIIVMMLIIGCFMETLAATAVILPTLYPIVMHMGVDPLLFGVLFSISTVVGALTPPVGLYLFLSMNIAQASFKQAISYTGPVVLIILAVMLLMWFFPPIVTYVPNLLMGA